MQITRENIDENLLLLGLFHGYDDFQQFAASNSYIFDSHFIENSIREITNNGFFDPITGKYVWAEEISIKGTNYRETIEANGLSSRNRAVLFASEFLLKAISRRATIDIYSPEAITEWSRKMRNMFPRYVGSEYFPSPEEEKKIWPYGHQDLCETTFYSSSFDLVITQEIFEHLPNLDKALVEIHRILKPNGWSINSHPFLPKSRNSIQKAKLINGEIIYLSEPEYHGNPIGNNGSLVFELPGWDILTRAKTLGFRQAEIWFIMSRSLGIFSDVGGIFISAFKK